MFRYHEDKMVNFNAQEGYTVVMTHKTSLPLLQKYQKNDDLDSYNLIQHSFELPTASSSVLFVHEVQFKHGGNYTCAPSNTRPTFLQVHVLKGKLKLKLTFEYLKMIIEWLNEWMYYDTLTLKIIIIFSLQVTNLQR